MLISVVSAAWVAAPARAGDLALTGTASASSTQGDLAQYAPAQANDGNSGTRWSSASADNQWWQVDLGSDQMINRIELNWEVEYASRYRIRMRRSGTSAWSTTATVSTSSPGWKTHMFSARSVRYVRISSEVRATPMGISLWDARVCDNNSCAASAPQPTPTATPTPTPTATPTPPPNPGAPTLTAADGGANYYGQFGNPLPTDPNFFPIAVWGSYNHTLFNRDLDAAAGINTYEWVADQSFLSQILGDNRFWTIQLGDRIGAATSTAPNQRVVGRYTRDELDMSCGAADSCYTQLENQIRNLNCANRCADGLALYANYGKGVLLWENDAQAARWINGTGSFGRYQDIVHTDLYWLTDPWQYGDPRYGFASSYGDDVRKVRRLDALDGKRQAVWHVVEAGWPFDTSAPATGQRAITNPELRAAVWHSIIAGARGILWFQHSFGGPCAGDHHVIRSNCEGTRPGVTAVNAQVKELASVVNAPFVTSGHSATDTMAGTVRYMVKWQGGNFYVFAAADRGGGDATFSIPCVGAATATRLASSNLPGEAKSIPIASGSFTDQFADKNAVHIYRIDGGSRCGL